MSLKCWTLKRQLNTLSINLLGGRFPHLENSWGKRNIGRGQSTDFFRGNPVKKNHLYHVSYKWLCSRSFKLYQDWSRPIKTKENRGRRGTMVWLLHCFAYCTIHIIFPAELRTLSQICKLISSSGNSALSQWKIKISYPPIHLGLAGTNIKTLWNNSETNIKRFWDKFKPTVGRK